METIADHIFKRLDTKLTQRQQKIEQSRRQQQRQSIINKPTIINKPKKDMILPIDPYMSFFS
jgi:hypothetical protein